MHAMNASGSKLIVLFCLLVFAVGCSRQTGTRISNPVNGFQPTPEYLAGQKEAQKDIQNGKLIVKTYGLPAPWTQVYYSNLLSRYQIESRPVAGCDITEALVQNVQGYNGVSLAEIEKRYGAGLLERVAKEAEQAWPQDFTNK